MKINQIIGTACLVLLAGVVSAEELKDPRYRVEDIYDTKVSAVVNRLPNGIYEYIYTLESGKNNTAEVASFSVDIGCNEPPSIVNIGISPDTKFIGDLSTDGRHVQVQLYQSWGNAVIPGISIDNRANWMLALKPGKTASGHKILSPSPPGPRTYEIAPYIDSEGWDYETYSPDSDDDVLWIPDFVVTGQVTGPSCGQIEKYAGSNSWGQEPREINQLLSYKKPTKNQFGFSRAETGFGMVIHYAYNIDPKTFKVEPTYLRKYFHPSPSTSEDIYLNINSDFSKNKAGKGKIKLSIRAIDFNEGKKNMKDTDVFYLHFDH